MITGAGGFGDLNSEMRRSGQFGSGGQPMPGPMPVMGGGSAGIRPAQHTTGGPSAAPATPAPASSMPYGQAKDPGAYGAPGAPGASPLGMWQSWLNTMGPYLAQMPSSEPMQESGGLSSLAPSAATPGTMRGFSGPDTPWQGNRGFRMLAMQ